jgi:hydroxymethylpyrimidine/phosphomethylpyrimidine kinase
LRNSPAIALTIAGSDPSGGAGIQADLKTFSALGVYGAAVIAALTAQNTREVRAVLDVPSEFLAQQIDAVFDDLRVDAVKLGMLGRRETIVCVAKCLQARAARNVVLDPVMVSKSGAKLLADDAIDALKRELVPLAAVITPNLPEASVLLGASEKEVAMEPERACRGLLKLGARAVVLKGGHSGGETSDDLLWDGRELLRFRAHRTVTENTHGTGCTFSSAIAALLARGETLTDAVGGAKSYVTAAIEAARDWRIGAGHGPVHHFHALWPKQK